jgi:hypothetical protein
MTTFSQVAAVDDALRLALAPPDAARRRQCHIHAQTERLFERVA